MRRVANVVGSCLMVAGVALLMYVAVAYQQARSQPGTPHWSVAQQNRGRHLAQLLSHRQRLVLPKRLTTMTPPGRMPAIHIVIPKIGVDAPVIETPPVNGVWPVADWAVGHLTTTPNPGAPGNLALSAHDDIKGEIFKRINELTPGDAIRVYTRDSVYTYVVTNQMTVDPSDVSVLNPTRDATLTLISCAPYWVDTQRIIVQATLKTRTAV